MATTYQGWLNDGATWYLIDPLVYLRDALRAKGYTVYDIGNKAHLTHVPPEDHTPYSATGFPGQSRYPYVHAIDIMPKKNALGQDDFADLETLAKLLIQDKRSGKAPFIKYMNYTTAQGLCWHISWQPNERITSSSDKGHIHLSARTDYWNSGIKYSPFASSASGSEEDEDMGQSWGGQVPAHTELVGAYTFSPGLVEGGLADPRQTWVSFGADTYGVQFALRVMQTNGVKDAKGNVFWEPVFDSESIVLASGERVGAQLKKGTVWVSVSHQAIKDGKAINPDAKNNLFPAWDGAVAYLVERGSVTK